MNVSVSLDITFDSLLCSQVNFVTSDNGWLWSLSACGEDDIPPSQTYTVHTDFEYHKNECFMIFSFQVACNDDITCGDYSVQGKPCAEFHYQNGFCVV